MFGEVGFKLPGAINNKAMSFASLALTGLTASQAVVTNASNLLTSLAYTNLNTISTLVQRDGSGNFSAGTITASLTGHASLDLLASNNLNDVGSATSSATNLGLGTGNSPAFTNLTLSGLTASVPVLTNGSKLLVSGTINLASASFVSGILASTNGGTGVNNASTITLGGNLSTAAAHTLSGAFASTFTFTGITSVTFPTSGTLATTGGSVASITGTANQITASAPTGAVTLSFPSILHSANNTLDDGGAGFSFATSGSNAGNIGTGSYTGTITVGNISSTFNINSTISLPTNPAPTLTGGITVLYNQSGIGLTIASPQFQVKTNTGGTAAVGFQISNAQVVTTKNNTLDDGTGIATFVNIIDSGLIASVPVLTNGSKQLVSGAINLASASFVSGILPSANGGTGVNNGSSTITIGGNTAFSGAFTFTGTLTANTAITFPVSGILATVGVSIPSANSFFYSFFGGF